MNLRQTTAIKTLTERAAELNVKDRGFGKSLADQFTTKGKLSEKQWYWVGVLADRIETAGVPDFTAGEASAAFGAYIAIVELLGKAQTKIKSPTITFEGEGVKASFGAAPLKGKNPGSVYVYWACAYVGKISKEGELKSNSAVIDKENARKLENFMQKLCADPAGVASQYGQANGKCCFCHKTLTDPTSMQVGYGQTCASNYGLKWAALKTTAKELVCEAAL